MGHASLAFEHALAQVKTIDQRVLEAQALYGLARTAAASRSLDQARKSAEASLTIYERLDSRKADEVRQFLAMVLGVAKPGA